MYKVQWEKGRRIKDKEEGRNSTRYNEIRASSKGKGEGRNSTKYKVQGDSQCSQYSQCREKVQRIKYKVQWERRPCDSCVSREFPPEADLREARRNKSNVRFEYIKTKIAGSRIKYETCQESCVK